MLRYRKTKRACIDELTIQALFVVRVSTLCRRPLASHPSVLDLTSCAPCSEDVREYVREPETPRVLDLRAHLFRPLSLVPSVRRAARLHRHHPSRPDNSCDRTE